ncbi:unnamed protein product [Leptosia nina]|uniref:glutathione transferase n=1 Tax=Leptosia nina TaxID=320188 RepID=A0AAV1J1E8_9NEOP
MARKLYYVDLNGLAESIRYILHYSGQTFEDIQYDHTKWPIQEIKDWLPYGQFPLYEEGGKTLNQSAAIGRYLSVQANLLPEDAWEQAELDATVLSIHDFWSRVAVYIKEKDPDKRAAIKKEVLEERIDYYFSRFEKELKKNNGHFGKKLSWADFVLVGFVEATNLCFDIELQKQFPTVNALINKVQSLPGVKEYIAKRKVYRV